VREIILKSRAAKSLFSVLSSPFVKGIKENKERVRVRILKKFRDSFMRLSVMHTCKITRALALGFFVLFL
jgi:hypothetical protein